MPPAPEQRHRHPGRLRVPDRVALAGVMYVLRTGVAWRDVPAETVGCVGVTAWRRLRDWTEAGVWPRLHAVLLDELRRAGLLDLDDCAVDGSHSGAQRGDCTRLRKRVARRRSRSMRATASAVRKARSPVSCAWALVLFARCAAFHEPIAATAPQVRQEQA